MCENLGKRKRRSVQRVGYKGEEEFERILMEEYGVTAEELREDDERSGMGSGFSVSEAVIWLSDGTRVTLYAEEDGDFNVFTYLGGLTVEQVFSLWGNRDNRGAIGGLIRYPGEWHEWLMVASLPFLKAMGIPLVWMKEYRTRTAECLFHYTDSSGQDQVGFHGGDGSGRMHIHLLRCYIDAYEKLQQGECKPGSSAGRVIADNLIQFVNQHYKERNEVPEGLIRLVNQLRSEG